MTATPLQASLRRRSVPLIAALVIANLAVWGWAFALFGDGLMDALNPQAKDSVGGAKDAL